MMLPGYAYLQKRANKSGRTSLILKKLEKQQLKQQRAYWNEEDEEEEEENEEEEDEDDESDVASAVADDNDSDGPQEQSRVSHLLDARRHESQAQQSLLQGTNNSIMTTQMLTTKYEQALAQANQTIKEYEVKLKKLDLRIKQMSVWKTKALNMKEYNAYELMHYGQVDLSETTKLKRYRSLMRHAVARHLTRNFRYRKIFRHLTNSMCDTVRVLQNNINNTLSSTSINQHNGLMEHQMYSIGPYASPPTPLLSSPLSQHELSAWLSSSPRFLQPQPIGRPSTQDYVQHFTDLAPNMVLAVQELHFNHDHLKEISRSFDKRNFELQLDVTRIREEKSIKHDEKSILQKQIDESAAKLRTMVDALEKLRPILSTHLSTEHTLRKALQHLQHDVYNHEFDSRRKIKVGGGGATPLYWLKKQEEEKEREERTAYPSHHARSTSPSPPSTLMSPHLVIRSDPRYDLVESNVHTPFLNEYLKTKDIRNINYKRLERRENGESPNSQSASDFHGVDNEHELYSIHIRDEDGDGEGDADEDAIINENASNNPDGNTDELLKVFNTLSTGITITSLSPSTSRPSTARASSRQDNARSRSTSAGSRHDSPNRSRSPATSRPDTARSSTQHLNMVSRPSTARSSTLGTSRSKKFFSFLTDPHNNNDNLSSPRSISPFRTSAQSPANSIRLRAVQCSQPEDRLDYGNWVKQEHRDGEREQRKSSEFDKHSSTASSSTASFHAASSSSLSPSQRRRESTPIWSTAAEPTAKRIPFRPSSSSSARPSHASSSTASMHAPSSSSSSHAAAPSNTVRPDSSRRSHPGLIGGLTPKTHSDEMYKLLHSPYMQLSDIAHKQRTNQKLQKARQARQNRMYGDAMKKDNIRDLSQKLMAHKQAIESKMFDPSQYQTHF